MILLGLLLRAVVIAFGHCSGPRRLAKGRKIDATTGGIRERRTSNFVAHRHEILLGPEFSSESPRNWLTSIFRAPRSHLKIAE